jgi:hypothetical protein
MYGCVLTRARTPTHVHTQTSLHRDIRIREWIMIKLIAVKLASLTQLLSSSSQPLHSAQQIQRVMAACLQEIGISRVNVVDEPRSRTATCCWDLVACPRISRPPAAFQVASHLTPHTKLKYILHYAERYPHTHHTPIIALFIRLLGSRPYHPHRARGDSVAQMHSIHTANPGH